MNLEVRTISSFEKEFKKLFKLDTNIILYILGGDKIIANYLLKKILYTSIICEIELLSYQSISLKEVKEIENFLKEFSIISIDQSIKELAIQLRKNIPLKFRILSLPQPLSALGFL